MQIPPERLLRLFSNFGPNDVVRDYCGVAAPGRPNPRQLKRAGKGSTSTFNNDLK